MGSGLHGDYSGQRCTAVKVVCVMESVADTLVSKVNEKVKKLSVGMPEKNCDITPVVSESSANFIQGLVEDAKEKGATFHQVPFIPLHSGLPEFMRSIIEIKGCISLALCIKAT